MNLFGFSKNKTRRNKMRKHRGGQGDIPTAENPVIENDDEIRINIENLYHPLRQAHPIYDANPVHVFNLHTFDIDENGNFYIQYHSERLIYGHVDENDYFVPEPGMVIQPHFRPMRVTANGQTSSLNYSLHSVDITPGNIIKKPRSNEGVFKTPGIPPKKGDERPINPMYTERQAPYTMSQIKDFIKYANYGIDFDPSDTKDAKRLLNLGLYGIYHNNTRKLYLKYEFIKAVFTDPKKKTQGYLVFRKGEPLRKKELADLSPILKDLAIQPFDNPKSAFGKEYREVKADFEKRQGQKFLEGERFADVIKELGKKRKSEREKSPSDSKKTRKSRSKSGSRSRSNSRSK